MILILSSTWIPRPYRHVSSGSWSRSGTGWSGTGIRRALGRSAMLSAYDRRRRYRNTWRISRRRVFSGSVFGLRVRGDSMIEAAICDGDIVVVRQQTEAHSGQIVAAMIDDEATVKVYRRRNGHVCLEPRNPEYDVIDGDRAVVLGIVVSVLRSV